MTDQALASAEPRFLHHSGSNCKNQCTILVQFMATRDFPKGSALSQGPHEPIRCTAAVRTHPEGIVILAHDAATALAAPHLSRTHFCTAKILVGTRLHHPATVRHGN